MSGRLRSALTAGAAIAAALSVSAAVTWRAALGQPAAWYGTSEAAELAGNVIAYQSDAGGWPKNIDFTRPPGDAHRARSELERAPTIDNGGTTVPLRFLARVIAEQHRPGHIEAANRGIDYLLAAQLPSGGWPQYHPLRTGYYSHITYNDNAMVNVLTLLRDVAAGRHTIFEFVDEPRSERARRAVEKGIECILKTQVRQNGILTGWCAQHDETTLEPAWARNFEPPSLSGFETVGIVRFLMSIEAPSPAVRAAVVAAVRWLETVPIEGLSVEDFTGEDGKRDRRAVANPSAHPLWARFYDLGTNRPIFMGRDRIARDDFNAVERERRINYAYLGTWPAKLLRDDFPRWRSRHGVEPAARN
jgi:PelA/Pel-15E family pectate lyase